MNATRGEIWFDALTLQRSADGHGPIRSADALLGAESARFIAVVPDPENRFPARNGQRRRAGARLAACARRARGHGGRSGCAGQAADRGDRRCQESGPTAAAKNCSASSSPARPAPTRTPARVSPGIR